jgi:hypothetical protein
MDVKTTFLSGVIEEEVYIEKPKGFEFEDRKTMRPSPSWCHDSHRT